MLLIGESFDGYKARDGGADSAQDAIASDGGFSGAPHKIDECVPTFALSNGIGYPDRTTQAIDIATTPDGGIVTDDDVRCYVPPSGPLPYCLLLVSSFRVRQGAFLGFLGARPLAIVSVGDVEIGGVLDVSGEDGYGRGGPGGHTLGAATQFGGGGSSATDRGGNGCDGGAGNLFEAGLTGGGNGGGFFDPKFDCHGGGNGGGAVQIVSLCGTVKLTGNGNINASGGGGGATSEPSCATGFGGGAGGTVWIESAKFTLDKANGASIDLSGGGGGGGACRNDNVSVWTEGMGASRRLAGGGAACMTSNGGNGGNGAYRDTPAENGNPLTAQAPGEASCGGAGGGRGLVVLRTQMGKCADIAGFQTGICRDENL